MPLLCPGCPWLYHEHPMDTGLLGSEVCRCVYDGSNSIIDYMILYNRKSDLFGVYRAVSARTRLV